MMMRMVGRGRMLGRVNIKVPVGRHHILRMYSQASETPAPPLLRKMKADMKSAMKAKNTSRSIFFS